MSKLLRSHDPEKKHTVTCVSDYRRGLDWVIELSDHLQVVTTNNYNIIAALLTTNHVCLGIKHPSGA
jgi:hypothetical protein